jgi:hypothetical protein
MPKKEDLWIAKLAKKNAGMERPSNQEKAVQYDPTLKQKPVEESSETKRLFKEMKKREF